MPTYITVLNTNLDKPKWIAVQESEDLDTIMNDSEYRSDRTNIFSKSHNDSIEGEKLVYEQTTHASAKAKVIKRGDPNRANLFKNLRNFFKRLFVFLVCYGLVTSCGSTGELTKRFKKVNIYNDTTGNIKKHVAVNPYFFEAEQIKPASPKTIFDLSPDGQKALIAAIREKETKSENVLAQLAKSIVAPKTEVPDVVDIRKFTKRLVIATTNLMDNPADRITRLYVTFHLPDTHYVQILSFDKLVTRFETIDIGKQNLSNTTSMGLKGSLGSAIKTTTSSGNTVDGESNNGFGSSSAVATEVNASNGIEGNISNERVFSEEVMLRQRYVAATFYVSPDSLTLYQESVSGIDLTGNVIADITFLRKDNIAAQVVYHFSNLTNNSQPSKPADILITKQTILFPNLEEDLQLEYGFMATVRMVESGYETISEADDSVHVVKGEVRKAGNVLLLGKDELKPKLWVIRDGDDELKIMEKNTSGGPVYFDSFQKASQFLLWLKQSYAILKNNELNSMYDLGLNGRKLDQSYILKAEVARF